MGHDSQETAITALVYWRGRRKRRKEKEKMNLGSFTTQSFYTGFFNSKTLFLLQTFSFKLPRIFSNNLNINTRELNLIA